MLERDRHLQIALFDTVPVLALNEALRPAEPTSRRPHLSSDREVHPEPESDARRAKPVPGVQAHVVRTLQECQVVVHATDHGGRDREQLEVVRSQRRRLVGARQRLVGVQPRPLRVGLATALEGVGHHVVAILVNRLRLRSAGSPGCLATCRPMASRLRRTLVPGCRHEPPCRGVASCDPDRRGPREVALGHRPRMGSRPG